MTTQLDDDPELTDDDADFIVRIRQTYDAYPAVQAPALRAPNGRRRSLVPIAAAAAVIGAVGGAAFLLPADAPEDRAKTAADQEGGVSEQVPGQGSPRESLLVPDVAKAWPRQSVTDCSTYVPGPSPQVVFVPRFTDECLRKVSFGSSVIFSSAEADELGGVDWPSTSEPWIEIDGVQALRKVRGEEHTISSTFIQGIWTLNPREYAVFIGEEAALAFETLTPEVERAPDGSSE